MEAKRAALPLFGGLRSRPWSVAWSILRSTWTMGAVVFLATWGGGIAAPEPFVIDMSLPAGLHIAFERGIDFGSDLVFTYGPLGFLKSYVAFYVWPARLAALYGIALHLALSLSLVYVARRSFPLPIAVALALVAATLMRGDLSATAVRDDAGVIVLAFIWCAVALQAGAPAWARKVVLFGGGPFAAIELIAKLNTGVIVLALLIVTALAAGDDWRRDISILASTFLGSLATLWFAVGQGLDDVGPFLTGTFEVITGYSSGAHLEWGTRDYDYLLAPALVVVAAAIGWISTRDTPGPRRVALLGLLALVAFTAFKAGFVRHDPFHVATFYATMLGACLAFRLPPRPELRAGALVAIAGVAAAGFTVSEPGYPMTDPIENARNGVSTVATVLDTGRLEEEITENRANLTGAYALDGETLKRLEEHTVHVDPSETAVAWAYGLDWSPLPVFQPYVAWTPELDRRNAEVVAAPDGPERILRQATNPVGRYPGFDTPAAMIEMLCHFEPLHTGESWQVLGRVPDRCGAPVPIGSVETQYGAPVSVPEADGSDAVFARVSGVQVSGLERAISLLYRPESRQVSFDGGPNYVFVPATAENGLLLRAPAAADFGGPFALAPNADEVTFLRDYEGASDRLRVEFVSMPIDR
jgi:hypothetical protein